jgi:hypothetical protein
MTDWRVEAPPFRAAQCRYGAGSFMQTTTSGLLAGPRPRQIAERSDGNTGANRPAPH